MTIPAKKTCPNCGKQFTPWRKKEYCSDRCRKQAENRRLRGDETAGATLVYPAENASKIDEKNQQPAKMLRGDERSPLAEAEWTAVNEVTHRLTKPSGERIGYAMRIEGQGWFGRVARDMSFGPTTLNRARQAVESYLTGQDFPKREGEKSWRGDCMSLVECSGPSQRNLSSNVFLEEQ